jgi:AcrR family transcriptional regulator
MGRSRREEYAEATRLALIAAARATFAVEGYAEASIETIVREARVTRGALYHHFTGKRTLFEAVVREIQAEVAESLKTAALNESTPIDRLSAGIGAFLATSHTPEYSRVVLQDAMSVLGWVRWREIDSEFMFAGFVAALDLVFGRGTVARARLALITHLLEGALTEAALTVAGSPAPEATAEEAREVIVSLITSFASDNVTAPMQTV